MNISVLTQVSCCARTKSHICHPCPSEFYSLPIQHGDAPGRERGTQGWRREPCQPGSGIEFRFPSRTSAVIELLSKLPKCVSPTLSIYYPSHTDLFLLISNAPKLQSAATSFFQVVNTCVNTNGSPAFSEVFGD